MDIKTTNQGLSFPRERDRNACTLRLERISRDLLQLRYKLSSYTCEPRTYNLYERIEDLRIRLENLRSANLEILTSLKEHRQTIEDNVERVKEQYREFRELEKGIADYMNLAKSC